jgi:phosphatidylserine decarboxylase
MASTQVLYRDRTSGRVEPERVFGESALRLLYGETRRGRLLRAIARRPLVSTLYGLRQRSPKSRGRVEGFARALGIDTSEAEKPLSEYRSLDDFFARRLRAGARPLDPDATHLASPCDARTLVFPRLEGTALPIKGRHVPLEQLLGDATLAARYAGGSAAILRLAPADYHRFHFPDTGKAGPFRAIPGPLDSVHPIALEAGAPSFLNKRHVTELESRGFGRLLLIEVGALCVGTIIQTYTPGPVERGAEKGTFRFGGSTVVLVAERAALSFDEDLVKTSGEGMETLVRMGTRIACRP